MRCICLIVVVFLARQILVRDGEEVTARSLCPMPKWSLQKRDLTLSRPSKLLFFFPFCLGTTCDKNSSDISHAGLNSTSPNTMTLSVSLIHSRDDVYMLHGCLSFNRLNSCGLLLMLACFPSAGCSCQVTLKCSCLCPFHELDTHQIICIWLRMDLGCEYVYKKSLTLYLALSPVPVKLYTFFPLGRVYEGQIFRTSSALWLA